MFIEFSTIAVNRDFGIVITSLANTQSGFQRM